MSSLDNKQLIKLIRYAPVVVVVIFASALNLIFILDTREEASLSIQEMREELIEQSKETIRAEVNQVYTQLMLEKSKTESELKNKVKQRVYEAYAIANHIYINNIDKPKPEVTRLIVEALKPLRFFDGRGYYFVIADDGTAMLNPAAPDLEGQNVLSLQGENGRYFVREMIEMTNQTDEAYMRWQFKKPATSDTQAFEKLGYVKKFEPLNWTIGAGDYLADYEESVKTRLLKWVSEYEFGENGYFFVLDNEGTFLAKHANDFLALDFIEGQKINEDLTTNIQTQVSNNGGFVRYTKPLTSDGMVSLVQMSYVKGLKDWGWVIGTSFNAQALEENLRTEEAELAKVNHHNLMQLIYFTIASLLVLTLSTLYVSHLIARRFELFQIQIKKDFDELKTAKERMEHMALHDALTELPNRFGMLPEIEKRIQSSSDLDEQLALMFVDLDNFKNVNDLYGHQHGDLMLELVSERFKTCITEDDVLARFGGDEFMFCFTNIHTRDDAEEKAKQIIESLKLPIIIDGRPLLIGCTVGVSMFPEDSTEAATLIRQADTVLYQSKSDKKGQILFYNNHINTQVQRKIEIEHALAGAIEREELSVYYQPQISAQDQKLVSVEALVRWTSADLGNVYPDEFIVIAEEAGMIHALDMFVFKKACEDILSLSPNGKGALKLSVNISPIQLAEHDLIEQLIGICESVGIDIERINLEITENIFIHGVENVQPTLEALRNRGFGISLDDFGTGYSSLSYFNQLPLTEIKIDRAFTEQFLESHQSDMLVRMIISIARVYELIVVAEGVETQEQLSKLINYGCDLLQGYYFDRPLTFSQLTDRVTQNS